MRFLDRTWAEGGYDDFSTNLYLGVYLQHLEDIAPDAPTNMRVLGAVSQGTGLIGTQVAATKLDADAKTFHLVIRTQTIEGERFLDLRYEGIQPENVDEKAFDGVDFLLTDELDVTSTELFEHRILLSPEGEFAIQFADLKLKLSKSRGEFDDE